MADRVACPCTVLEKHRLGDRGVEISVPAGNGHRDRTPVLVDDIIASARTMAVAVGRLRSAFASAPACVGVHAVFSPDALDVLQQAGAARIVTCNTLAHQSNPIDVLGEVALGVRALCDGAAGPRGRRSAGGTPPG